MLVVSAMGRSSPPHLLPMLLCIHRWIDRQQACYLHPHHNLFSLYFYPLIHLSAFSSLARVSSLSIAGRFNSLCLTVSLAGRLAPSVRPSVSTGCLLCVIFASTLAFELTLSLSSYLLLVSSSLQRRKPVVADQNLAGGPALTTILAQVATLYIASH
jgi:hypothetical protein